MRSPAYRVQHVGQGLALVLRNGRGSFATHVGHVLLPLPKPSLRADRFDHGGSVPAQFPRHFHHELQEGGLQRRPPLVGEDEEESIGSII